MTTVDSHELGRCRIMPEGAELYIAFCKSTFAPGADLKGLKIVIDCANGATYHIAPHIFAELGAEVIAIHNQPDGFNINENCGSTHPEALQKAVLAHQADLGIAFDGDGDRLLMVDDEGEIVDGDELLFIIASGYHAQGILNGGVVGTQMSNLGLENAFKALDIPFMRAKVGDRYVMDALMQTGWSLGGEGSGHIICLDKTTTGDGIISALQVLSQMLQREKSLNALKKGMDKCAQILLNVPVANAQAIALDPKVQQACFEAEKELSNRGRILLRPSGTEPLIRVMVEGEDKLFISQIAESIAQMVKTVAAASSVS
jgi:phosphoglucosamine mutase